MKNWQKLFILFFIFIIGFVGLHNPHPVFAENGEETTASVIIDGQEIFEVTTSDRLTADERAEWINLQLEKAVNAERSPSVRIEQRNNSPTVLVNGRYLLTVTEDDVSQEMNPEEQAEIWEDRLETSLEAAYKARKPEYIRRRMILASVILGGMILLHLGLVPLGKSLVYWLLKQRYREASPETRRDRLSFNAEEYPNLHLLFRLVIFILRIVLWGFVLIYVASLFPVSRQWSYWLLEVLDTAFTSPLVQLGNDNYSVIDFLILLGMFWGLLLGTGSLTRLIKNRFLRFTRIERGIQEAISIVIKYSLITLGAIILLQVWGLNLSSIAILGSALGVGIGFGFQDIAKNFASGLVLLFERSVQVGDFIEINDRIGTVERVGARSIVLRTLDQISVIIPNSRLLEDEVINWSHDNPVSRLHLPVGVAYGSHIETVKNALLEAAKHHPLVLAYPPPRVIFQGFGDSSLDFELLVWSGQPDEQINIKSDLYFHVEELLREYDVEIPFPQRDLHLRSGLPPQLTSALLQVLGKEKE